MPFNPPVRFRWWPRNFRTGQVLGCEVIDSRVLGSTGLAVSRMGLGLAALGRPAYINVGHAQDLNANYSVDAMRQRTAEVLDAAWAEGVRYVDTARSYGRAEEFLASWLAPRPADLRPTVGSKWGYTYTGNWQLQADAHEVKEHSVQKFRQQLAESRRLLGADLALYQVHSLTLDSPVLTDDAMLDALADLRATGTAVGMSLSGTTQAATLERALEIRRGGEALFSAVQATWNALEPSAGPMLSAAYQAGLGVIIKEGVANGRLSPRTPDLQVRRVLGAIADRQQVSIDAVALAYVLAQPWAHVVLSGAVTVAHLRANLRATSVRLTPDDHAALATLAEDRDDYWTHRSELEWG